MNTYEDCTVSNNLLPTTLNVFSNGDFLVSLQTIYSNMKSTVIRPNTIHDIVRISNTEGNVIWATRYSKISILVQTITKTYIDTNDSSWILSTFSGSTNSSAISILDQSGNLVKFIKLTDPALKLDLFVNDFYIKSSSDLIVSIQLNKITNGYGVSNSTDIDIELASISLNLTCNWLLAIDIESDPNYLTNMAYYNNLLYILGQARFDWIYLLSFNLNTKIASNLMSYSVNSNDLPYKLFNFEIADFNDPFMLSTLSYGDVLNYVTNAIVSNQSSNVIISCSLLIPNISNAFVLYSKFVNSTRIIIYQGKDDSQNGKPYAIYISTITINGSGVVQSSKASYVSRSSNIVFDFNKMLAVSYLSTFYSFSYESTIVTQNGSQINPWYFRIHRLDGYFCDDYCICNNTDVSSTVQSAQVVFNSFTLSLAQAVSNSVPSVVDATLDSDFVEFSNKMTCLFGQSSRFSLDICQYNDPKESSYAAYFTPQLSSGTYNITIGTSNTTITLIDYCMSSQFFIKLSVNGNTTLPSWIYVDELNWEIKIIGGNITNIGTYSVSF